MFRDRRRVILITGPAALVVAAVVAFVLLDGSSGSAPKPSTSSTSGVYVPQLGETVSKATAKAAANSLPPNPNPKASNPTHKPPPRPLGQLHTAIEPAKISEHPQGFASSSLVWPLVNEWSAGSHRKFTAVDAGRTGRDDGVFAIFRQDFVHVNQDQNFVKVAGAGALRITRAPQGPKVVGWAQRRGKLEFTSANGVAGTLHLSDDSITLNR